MVFHSPNFLIFFLALWIPFLFWKRGRIGLLAAANLLFYGYSGLGMLAVFVAVTAVVYAAVRLQRKPGYGWAFWVGLLLALGNLIFFKYTLFVADTLEAWLGFGAGFRDEWAASIVLPVGISFYTFQLISYLIDVRRGDYEPTKSFLRFWVYISLFPQLVAGPILRGPELMPQIEEIEQKQVRWQDIKYGLFLFAVGFVKKVVFADPIADVVNPLFAQGDAISAVDSWIAAFAFGFQIYYDFSAYSDMALGLGYMLGLRLILNFNSPYLSSNPSEFWRRWHISLSRWIRDYVYIGLGGNRRGPVRVQFNLLAAMTISGLWHGAMWTFVLWGAVHGLLLIAYKGTLWFNRWTWVKRVRDSWPYRIAAIVAFFHIVTWTWVFFRAQSFGQAWDMTVKMATVDWSQLYADPRMLWVLGWFALHLFEFVIRNYERQSSRVWHWVPFPVRSAAYAAIALVVLYYVKGETYDFIYFQF